MDIDVQREGTTIYAKPGEEIHFDNYKEVEDLLVKEIEAGAKEVVLDLSNVTSLYSMTLGMFNKIAGAITDKGGQFSITNVNHEIRRVLKATRLDKMIHIK